MKATNIKPKILISACLLGNQVRYNGTGLLLEHPLIKKWQEENRLVAVCPEVAGGMTVPRAPAEIIGGNAEAVLLNRAMVMDNTGKNVSAEFIQGARQALALARENNCVAAILTERSPSCASHYIYDGNFTGKKISGMGITSFLLEQNDIKVFNQEQLEQLAVFLASPRFN